MLVVAVLFVPLDQSSHKCLACLPWSCDALPPFMGLDTLSKQSKPRRLDGCAQGHHVGMLARRREQAVNPTAALLAVLLAAAAVLASGRRLPKAVSDDSVELIPWQHEQSQGKASFPWEGLHNDLPQLLKVQARSNVVTVMVFNHGYAPLALNCYVSLVRYGYANNIIVAVLGDASLAHCRSLRLPCYNATALTASGADVEEAALRKTRSWFDLVWAKTLVTNEVFNHGYDVIFTDTDVVYLKPLLPAYRRFLSESDADGTFMYEEAFEANRSGVVVRNRYLNSGTFMLLNNNRTRHMMAYWMKGYQEHKAKHGNQLWLNWMRGPRHMAYGMCFSRQNCTDTKAAGLAAIRPHPNQFEGEGNYQAPLNGHVEDLCHDRRLYVHVVGHNGHGAKKQVLDRMGLWMIDMRSDKGKVMVDPASPELLACKRRTVWQEAYT